MNGRLTAKGAELNQLQERRRESRQKTIVTIIGFTTQNRKQHIICLSIGHYFFTNPQFYAMFRIVRILILYKEIKLYAQYTCMMDH